MDVGRIVNNIDRVINEVSSYAVEILSTDYKKELIEIQQGQLREGIRGDGKKTKKYRSKQYIRNAGKQSARSFPNRNYFNEGDFYKGQDVSGNGDDLFFVSYDSKASFLEKEEDDNLLGIAPKNIGQVDGIKGFAKKLINKTGNELSR